MKKLTKSQKQVVKEVWQLKSIRNIGDNIKEWIERNIQ
jgi:hypothetical protein